MKKLKTTQRHVLPVLIVAVIVGCLAVPAIAADPLRSWRDGTNKQLIIEFVEKVTTPGVPSFVAPEDRVATFDMDGTILLEKPAYSLFAFAIPLIKAAAAAQPTLLERPHVKAPKVIDGVEQMAFDGKALNYSFNDPKAKDSRTVQYYELFGNRAIYAELFINDKSVGKTHIAKTVPITYSIEETFDVGEDTGSPWLSGVMISSTGT